MVSEAIINKQLTEQYPKMLEVVHGNTKLDRIQTTDTTYKNFI